MIIVAHNARHYSPMQCDVTQTNWARRHLQELLQSSETIIFIDVLGAYILPPPSDGVKITKGSDSDPLFFTPSKNTQKTMFFFFVKKCKKSRFLIKKLKGRSKKWRFSTTLPVCSVTSKKGVFFLFIFEHRFLGSGPWPLGVQGKNRVF